MTLLALSYTTWRSTMLGPAKLLGPEPLGDKPYPHHSIVLVLLGAQNTSWLSVFAVDFIL